MFFVVWTVTVCLFDELMNNSTVLYLCRLEVEEGCKILLEKLKQSRPKIAVFNGKGRYILLLFIMLVRYKSKF